MSAGVIGQFSGATAFGAASDGTYINGITSTLCCQTIGIEVGTFTGLTSVTPDVALTNGVNVLYLESGDWTYAFEVATGGLNLFFDDSGIPGISVHITPVYDKTDFSQSFSVTSAGVNTADLFNDTVSASGTSVYTNGPETITLTGLQWVGGYGGTGEDNPYDANYTVQRVELTVSGLGDSPAPEPGSVLLIGAGLTALAVVRRRKTVR